MTLTRRFNREDAPDADCPEDDPTVGTKRKMTVRQDAGGDSTGRRG